MYTGIFERELDDQQLADFYEGKLRFDLLQNQYLIIKNQAGDIIDSYRYDGKKTVKVKFKSFNSSLLGEIKPKNEKQKLFCDLLNNEGILLKVVSGIAGSGKTFLSTAWALQELQQGTFNKFIIVRNNINVADVPDIGAVPGTELEKMKQYCAFMSDIMSDIYFDTFIDQKKIEVAYLGTMRGRSLSNSIVLVSEAQNLTTALVKMIVTRIGEGSVLIFDYDIDQIDKKSFEKDNGMLRLTESLKGHPLFGMVELDLIERSAVARMAELIQ